MKRTLTPDEAAAVLGVSRRTVFNMIRDGRLETARPPHVCAQGYRIVTESAQQLRERRTGQG